MKKIRLLRHYATKTLSFAPGNVIGVNDITAENLVYLGIAQYVADDVRSLRYAPDAPMQQMCFSSDDKEFAEKGATPLKVAAPVIQESPKKKNTRKSGSN